jgi:polyhydroxybutyrate depolymerase
MRSKAPQSMMAAAIAALTLLGVSGCDDSGTSTVGPSTSSATTAPADPGDEASPTNSPTTEGVAPDAVEVGPNPSPGCAEPSAPVAEITLTVDGTERRALVNIPSTDEPEPIPLILSFHGAGMTPEAQAILDEFTDEGAHEPARALVVRPAGLAQPRFGGEMTGWNLEPDVPIDDVAFVTALLDRLEAQYCVDLDRVYAAGMSNGGGMAELLACSLPDRVAAVALVSAMSMSIPCAADAPVPIIAFRGTLDLFFPYAGSGRGDNTFPFEQWADEWADRNGCDPGRQYDPPEGQVQPMSWSGCEAATEAYRLYGYGHAWPRLAPGPARGAAEAAQLATCDLPSAQENAASYGVSCEDLIRNIFLDPFGYSAAEEILRFFAENSLAA